MAPRTRFIRRVVVVFSVGLFLSGFVLAAFAQEKAPAAETTKKWMKKPSFSFKLGGFFPSVSMKIRVDEPGGGEGTDIDVEKDLGLGTSASTFRLDGDIRIAKWFSLGLDYYGFKRSAKKALDKDIQIGGTVFPVQQTINTTLNTIFGNVDFKFYILHRERLDFGVYAGAYLTHFKINVDAQELGRRLVEIRKIWAPIPSIGLHFWYEPIPKLMLYAKAGYFTYNTKRWNFDSTTINLNVEYYFYKFVGIGARGEYSAMRLKLDLAGYHGKLDYNIGGAQAYIVLAF